MLMFAQTKATYKVIEYESSERKTCGLTTSGNFQQY